MSRQEHSSPLIPSLATLSLLLVLVACSDSPGNEPIATLTRIDLTPNADTRIDLTPNAEPPTPGKDNEPAATPTPAPFVYDPYATPGPVYDVEAAKAELAAARALWRSEWRSGDYDLESLVSCLCEESNIPLKLTVRNWAIESVVDLRSGRAWTEEELADEYTYRTINGRFDQIEIALSNPVHYLKVEYHPSVGYPTYIDISYLYNVPDDGFTLKRLIYEPVDGDGQDGQ